MSVLALLLYAGVAAQPLSLSDAAFGDLRLTAPTATGSGVLLLMRGEIEAGYQRAVGGSGSVPTADFTLAPSLAGQFRIRDVQIAGLYAPEVTLRLAPLGAFDFGPTDANGDTFLSLTPLFSHALALTLVGGRELRGIGYDVGTSLLFGVTSFNNVVQRIGPAAGLGGAGGAVPILSADVNGGLATRPGRDVRLATRASAGIFGTTLGAIANVIDGDNTGNIIDPNTAAFAERLSAPLDVIAAQSQIQLFANLDGSAEWAPTVNDFVLLDIGLGGALDPFQLTRVVSLRTAVEYTRRFGTRFQVQGSVGAVSGLQFGEGKVERFGIPIGLVYETPPGPLDGAAFVWPLVEASVTQAFLLRAFGEVSYSLSVGLLPQFDPFIGAITERAGGSASLDALVWRNVRGNVSLSWFTLVAVAQLPSTRQQTLFDDHIVDVSATLGWAATAEWGLETGVSFSARARNPILPLSNDRLVPQLLFFIAGYGGVGFRT